jgi:hypothetical protein
MTDTDLQVTFYDHLMPRATAGVYTLRAEQHLSKDGSDITTMDPLPIVDQKYEIRAVRFFVDDSSVHAYYPAEGAHGDYSRTLPHITLNRSILPWERQLLGRAEVRSPWLALLVFGAGELGEDPDGRGVTTTRTVAELCDPGDPKVLGPDLDVPVDIQTTRCQTIDVAAELFTSVVPREEELRYLAHVRDVGPLQKLRDEEEILTEGQYAVLAANRFPRTPGAYAVHLVSLEGFLDRLGPGQLPADISVVRLCALRSWSFTSDPDGQLNAAKLLEGLAEPGRTDPENLALRLAPAASGSTTPGEAEKHARQRLWLGYVPVTYRVLSGELTYGWYRGPFTPITAQSVPAVGGPHTTADHALIYDAEHGVFDVSYAAAWTLGRALALSDPQYTEELTRVRREVANLAVGLMTLGADPARADLDPDAAAGNALHEVAAEGFGHSLIEALAQSQVSDEIPSTRRSRLAREDARALLHQERQLTVLRTAVARRTATAPTWLDTLALMHLVPFRYLVPHPAMLPPESLRLFRIDPGWIDALLAGARDLGVHSSLDVQADAAVRHGIDQARSATLPVAGILVYSQLVRAWPVFDLIARLDGNQVSELRRDRLAPNLLLCLFDNVPDEIAIREPRQGIHFGIDTGDVISLRDLPPGDHLGFSRERQFPKKGTGTVFSRYLRPVSEGTPDVLNLRETDGLVVDLASEFDLSDLSPGQFALELINAPVEQRLTIHLQTDDQEF